MISVFGCQVPLSISFQFSLNHGFSNLTAILICWRCQFQFAPGKKRKKGRKMIIGVNEILFVKPVIHSADARSFRRRIHTKGCQESFQTDLVVTESSWKCALQGKMSLKLHLPFPHPRFLSSFLLKKRKVRLIRVVLFWFRLCLCPRMNYDHLHHTDNFSTTFKQEANRTNWHYWLINTGQSRQPRATWVSSRVSSRQTRPISLHELYLIHWTDKQLLTWLGWWFPLTRTIRVQDQGLLKQCSWPLEARTK